MIRPDGGVDVVDSDGNIVSQVDPPWAYDALGRPQNTWYTYDPDTGLLTQHVEPASNALYPIIADPEKSNVGIVDTTGRKDGESWQQKLPNGEVATHTIVDGTGGQTVDTHTERADGSYSDIRSINNDVGGVDVYSNDSDGSSHFYQNNIEQDNTYTASYDQDPVPGYTPAPVGESYGNYDNSEGGYWSANPNGSISTGTYERISDTQYQTVTTNPDGSNSTILSTERADGGISTMVSDDAGTRVSTDGVTTVNIDDSGNDISLSDNPNADTGRFYNEDTGQWMNGAVVDGVDTPVYRMEDGSLVYGMTNKDGDTDWVTTKPSGESAVVRELAWNEDSSPTVVDQDPFVSDVLESVTGVPVFSGADAAGAIYGAGTDTPTTMAELEIRNDVAAGRMSQEVGEDLLKNLK